MCRRELLGIFLGANLGFLIFWYINKVDWISLLMAYSSLARIYIFSAVVIGVYPTWISRFQRKVKQGLVYVTIVGDK